VTVAPHVLVTGGAGFVGSHVVDALVLSGCRVSVIDDLSRGRREWLPEGVRFYEVDIRDRVTLHEVVRDANADAVVHLAALHFIPAVDDAPELARQVNVAGTRNLLRSLAEAPPARLLFASTAAVYPDLRTRISEVVGPAPIDLYGATKLLAEKVVHRFANETGTRSAIVRLFNVVGPRETNPHVVEEIVRQLAQGKDELELGSLDASRDFVDVRDVAEAIRTLLVGSPGEICVFNVGSGRATSVRELVEICGSILGREIRVRQMPDRIRTVDRRVLCADISAVKTVGWQPERTLRETLTELLRDAHNDAAHRGGLLSGRGLLASVRPTTGRSAHRDATVAASPDLQNRMRPLT
jgi:UDP-glucose 4-epimerase